MGLDENLIQLRCMARLYTFSINTEKNAYQLPSCSSSLSLSGFNVWSHGVNLVIPLLPCLTRIRLLARQAPC